MNHPQRHHAIFSKAVLTKTIIFDPQIYRRQNRIPYLLGILMTNGSSGEIIRFLNHEFCMILFFLS
jgi:hypothetical protein